MPLFYPTNTSVPAASLFETTGLLRLLVWRNLSLQLQATYKLRQRGETRDTLRTPFQ
jgi:hypothetical protein